MKVAAGTGDIVSSQLCGLLEKSFVFNKKNPSLLIMNRKVN